MPIDRARDESRRKAPLSEPIAALPLSPGGLPRWIEVVAALGALTLLCPLLLAIGLLVRLTSAGSALFRQQRIGRRGVPFTMLKFRSMSTDNVGSAVTAAGDQRVTALGSLLRASKLDELPELWNIVRGDMSWVGPRPEVPRYVDLERPQWGTVLQARPGLTDPATLLLRNEESLLQSLTNEGSMSVEEVYRDRLLPIKLGLSIDYLKRRTAWTDLAILGATLFAIVRPAAQPNLDDLERYRVPQERPDP